MNYGQFGRARWGVSAMALATAVGFAVPAVAQVEILISATRRAATTVQDVPLAVTAYGSDTLQNAGVQDVRDLVALAPSFTFLTGQSNAAGTTAYLRGVGTGGDNPGFESAVGFFVDGIYRSRSGVALSDLPAVDRVEVLRGPQGTLFGKNTTAGAIHVITAAPSHDGAIYGSATLGNLGIREFNAGFTAPLADNVAIRIDANSRKRDGYITDVRGGPDLNDRDRWMVRGQALLDFNDTSSMRLIFDVSQTNEICCGAVTVKRGGAATAIEAFIAPFSPGLQGVLNAPLDPEGRNMSVTPGRNLGEGIDEWGVSGEYNTKLGNVNFTSITSYRDWSASRNQDIDFSDLDRAYREGQRVGFKTFTQEMRFQGNSGALDWLVGGYYAHESLPLRDTIRTGTQAGAYLDALAAATDFNGDLVPDRREVYGTLTTLVGAPFTQSWFSTAMGTLAATLNPVTPGFALVQGAIAAAGAGLNAGLGLPANYPLAGHGQQADNWKQSTSSWALFTHDQIALGPSWMLTLGLRYNHEKKNMKADLDSVVPGCGVIQANASGAAAVASAWTVNLALPAATRAAANALRDGVLQSLTLVCNPAINTIANGSFADSNTDKKFSGTGALSWEWSDNLLFYTSYSRGYKAGGWNLDRSGFNIAPFSAGPILPPLVASLRFRPELVNSYEAGWKWQSVGGNLIINGTLFLEKIKDYQLNAFSGFNFLTTNVPKAVSRGVEVDLYAEPHKNLTWQGGATFLEAFHDSDANNPNTGAPLVRKGDKFDHAPKWSVTSAVTWTVPTGAHTNFMASVDARWNSAYPTQGLALFRDPSTANKEFAIVNGRLGFAGANGGWAIEAWAKNLTDELYYLGGFAVPEQDTYDIYPNLPRTYGGTFRAKF
jgi:outer membrane receptor protein involved in Fe transport